VVVGSEVEPEVETHSDDVGHSHSWISSPTNKAERERERGGDGRQDGKGEDKKGQERRKGMHTQIYHLQRGTCFYIHERGVSAPVWFDGS